jgi:hypothetical protein
VFIGKFFIFGEFMKDNLIPFGKYKGQPIEAIQEDQQYVDWLLAQSWFRDKHQEFYTIIINNFQEAAETPQHNAMHVKFLNDDYVLDVLSKYEAALKSYFVINRRFEYDGWDVVVEIQNYDELTRKELKEKASNLYRESRMVRILEHTKSLKEQAEDIYSSIVELRFYIEIKPAVSDDFPAILRQIKAQRTNNDSYSVSAIKRIRILLVGEYTGSGATQDEFVAFMKNENINVIFDSQ